MELISTRSLGRDDAWSFRDALFQGQAPDGGLFVPAALPAPPDDRLSAETLAAKSFPERAFAAARHILEGELTADVLRSVVDDAFDFPVPLRAVEPGISALELFHGPTLAFKDFGARFMARTVAALKAPDSPPITVLAATSGDTGGAVARAFRGVPGVRVVVLYPEGRVTREQEAQIAAAGRGVAAVAVQGSFDDCQRMARAAFADDALVGEHRLTSANSINVGRLIPQTFHYLHAAVEVRRRLPGRRIVFSVPSGNFGHLAAGLIARKSYGLAGVRFTAATNANAVFGEWLERGRREPRASVPTLSSAMDVGDPSNLDRIPWLSGSAAKLRRLVRASSWSDRRTRACIREVWRARRIALDPHTAVGLLGLRRALAGSGADGAHGVVLATAHPAKFASVVEPLIGERVRTPRRLASLLDRPRRSIRIGATLGELVRTLGEAPEADG